MPADGFDMGLALLTASVSFVPCFHTSRIWTPSSPGTGSELANPRLIMSTGELENEAHDTCADHETLAEQSLSGIEASAAALTSEVAAQDILMWLDRSAWLLERAKAFRRFVEQAAIGW